MARVTYRLHVRGSLAHVVAAGEPIVSTRRYETEGSGTAFAFDDSHAITAAHCLGVDVNTLLRYARDPFLAPAGAPLDFAGLSSMQYTLEHGARVLHARPLSLCPEADLALLELEDGRFPASLDVSEAPTDRSDNVPIVIYGYTDGFVRELAITAGMSVSNNVVTYRAYAQHLPNMDGASGGPVLTYGGAFVGVFVDSNREQCGIVPGFVFAPMLMAMLDSANRETVTLVNLPRLGLDFALAISVEVRDGVPAVVTEGENVASAMGIRPGIFYVTDVCGEPLRQTGKDRRTAAHITTLAQVLGRYATRGENAEVTLTGHYMDGGMETFTTTLDRARPRRRVFLPDFVLVGGFVLRVEMGEDVHVVLAGIVPNSPAALWLPLQLGSTVHNYRTLEDVPHTGTVRLELDERTIEIQLDADQEARLAASVMPGLPRIAAATEFEPLRDLCEEPRVYRLEDARNVLFLPTQVPNDDIPPLKLVLSYYPFHSGSGSVLYRGTYFFPRGGRLTPLSCALKLELQEAEGPESWVWREQRTLLDIMPLARPADVYADASPALPRVFAMGYLRRKDLYVITQMTDNRGGFVRGILMQWADCQRWTEWAVRIARKADWRTELLSHFFIMFWTLDVMHRHHVYHSAVSQENVLLYTNKGRMQFTNAQYAWKMHPLYVPMLTDFSTAKADAVYADRDVRDTARLCVLIAQVILVILGIRVGISGLAFEPVYSILMYGRREGILAAEEDILLDIVRLTRPIKEREEPVLPQDVAEFLRACLERPATVRHRAFESGGPFEQFRVQA